MQDHPRSRPGLRRPPPPGAAPPRAAAPARVAEPGRVEELRSLAVPLTRLMLLSPILFGISGMLTGILNARQHFVAPALAPLLYNLSIILGALLLAGPLGVRGLAIAVVA